MLSSSLAGRAPEGRAAKLFILDSICRARLLCWLQGSELCMSWEGLISKQAEAQQLSSALSTRLGRCRQILRNSPTALRVLKAALNAAEDGHAGLQVLGGEATSLFYQTQEGNEVGLTEGRQCIRVGRYVGVAPGESVAFLSQHSSCASVPAKVRWPLLRCMGPDVAV